MQGPTHLAAGILLQRAMRKVRPVPLQYFIVAVLALISHGILDRLARATYHPSAPLPDDWFWIVYHVIVALTTLYVIIKFWAKYKVGIIFSILPDVDWFVLHLSNAFSTRVPFWREPILHRAVFRVTDFFLPPRLLSYLPVWGLQRRGAVVEIILLVILFTCIYRLQRKDSDSKNERVGEEGDGRRDNLLQAGIADKTSE